MSVERAREAMAESRTVLARTPTIIEGRWWRASISPTGAVAWSARWRLGRACAWYVGKRRQRAMPS